MMDHLKTLQRIDPQETVTESATHCCPGLFIDTNTSTDKDATQNCRASRTFLFERSKNIKIIATPSTSS